MNLRTISLDPSAILIVPARLEQHKLRPGNFPREFSDK